MMESFELLPFMSHATEKSIFHCLSKHLLSYISFILDIKCTYDHHSNMLFCVVFKAFMPIRVHPLTKIIWAPCTRAPTCALRRRCLCYLRVALSHAEREAALSSRLSIDDGEAGSTQRRKLRRKEHRKTDGKGRRKGGRKGRKGELRTQPNWIYIKRSISSAW